MLMLWSSPAPPSQCGLRSWIFHLQFCWWNTANWYSRRKFPFAASSAACNFLFAHLHILTSYQSLGCEITFPCCSVRFPDTVLPCIPWSFEFLHWHIAFSSLDLWILLLTSMCCVCVCVWAEECFCGQISEKHVFSSCALSLSFNSIHSLFCQILFSTCNVATFVSIFLHGAGFSVSHCKTASPSCCDKNILPNFLQKIENLFFLLYFLNPLAVCSVGNTE